jgi:predicted DNA-binding transcriptional regulator AlpA
MTSFKSQLHLMSPERTANFTQGTFPKPVSLGGRAVGWLEAEVQQWLQRRIEASRKVKV